MVIILGLFTLIFAKIFRKCYFVHFTLCRFSGYFKLAPLFRPTVLWLSFFSCCVSIIYIFIVYVESMHALIFHTLNHQMTKCVYFNRIITSSMHPNSTLSFCCRTENEIIVITKWQIGSHASFYVLNSVSIVHELKISIHYGLRFLMLILSIEIWIKFLLFSILFFKFRKISSTCMQSGAKVCFTSKLSV